jgi:actin-like ATPase involved in cell morphogenesis
MFPLGVDIGCTAVKAGVWRRGRAELICVPGPGAPPVPELMGERLRAVLPELPRASRIVLAYPAGWGAHRSAALRASAGLDGDALLLPAPVAAAYHLAGPLRSGVHVAVVHLGRRLSTATVIRGTGSVPELVGEPTVVPIGAVDLDDALRVHVESAAGVSHRNPDVAAQDAVRRELHGDVIAAKEALSDGTEVVVPVRLPGGPRHVELTRTVLETLARPLFSQVSAALADALDRAGVTPEEVTAVRLSGGFARVPVAATVIAAELGIPVTPATADAADAAALGAVRAAGAGVDRGADEPVHSPAPAPPPPAPVVAPRTSVSENSVTVRTEAGGGRTGAVVFVLLIVLAVIAAVLLSRPG